jgi:hypothetical protein
LLLNGDKVLKRENILKRGENLFPNYGLNDFEYSSISSKVGESQYYHKVNGYCLERLFIYAVILIPFSLLFLLLRITIPDILMEDDKPLSDSERSSKEHYSHLEKKRKSAYDKLQDVRNVRVTKENIVKDLIELYKDPSITNCRLLMEIAGQEDAVGSGVLREAYSLFWDNLLANNTMGETEFTIPIAPHFTCEDYVSIGRIITHQFVQCGAFPVRISQASVTQALVGDVSPDMLISSFLKLLPPREREIVEKGLSDSAAFSQDEIMEILEDYNINTLPTTANLASLITQIGRNELAQKPYLYLLRIRRGMGLMWDGVSEEEIASIYNLSYVIQKDPKDGKIMRWLQRHLKICSNETLVNFLRFCTATDVMRPECRIKVSTEFMPPAAIRPKSRTCFGIMILPRNYTSFAQLRKNMDFYLRNPSFWDLSD